MPPFEYEEVKLTLTVEGESFSARGKSVKNNGWKDAYSRSFDTLEDESDEDEKEQLLPNLRQGDRMEVLSSKVTKGETKPPKRYTEATLLTAMEHPASKVESRALGKILEETSGLGTPATRADIIEKLFSTFYIERRGKELVPTPKGIQLVGIVPEDLRSPELTAKWEDRLAKIAKNQDKDSKFIDEMKGYASKLVTQVKASDAVYVHHNQTKEKCPDCGKNLLRVKGKRGEMLVCPDRECGYRRSLSQTTNARCPNCHKKMELRGEGDKQSFYCVCGYREKLSAFKERRSTAGAGKSDVRRFMAQQQKQNEKPSNPMAAQLAKWLEDN